MSPPLRPNTAPSRPTDRPEPRFAGPAVEPLRVSAPRSASAKPAVEAAASPPLRFPGEARHAHDLSRLSVSADDRIIVSSPNPGSDKRRRGPLRSLGLVALCLLAAFGAYTLYHWLSGAFLP
jgi:hypothetical protein